MKRLGAQGVFRGGSSRRSPAVAPLIVRRPETVTGDTTAAPKPLLSVQAKSEEPGQDHAVPMKVGSAVQVLSAPGGPIALTESQRQHCLILRSDNAALCDFFVQNKYLADGDFLSAIIRAAERAGFRLKTAQLIDFERLRDTYSFTDVDPAAVGNARAEAKLLFERAALSEVSDIQVIPESDKALVQFQVQGYLTEPDARDEIHLGHLHTLHTGVHNMATHGDPIPNRHKDQRVTITNRDVLPAGVAAVRVQWVPAGAHRHMNCRLIYDKPGGREPSIDHLQMPEEIRVYLYHLLTRSKGLFTITGPTESGKSWTQTCFMMSLHERHGRRLLIPSLADPPEGYFPGILNYAINTDDDDAETSVVERLTRATLRVSPHVVNFAEIRSPLMAREAFRASTQGKFILATTHTDEALEVPDRYVKLGIDFTDAFSPKSHAAMLSQRLVPHLCPHCSLYVRDIIKDKAGRYYAADLEIYRKALGDFADTLKVRGEGCSQCKKEDRISIPGLVERNLYMELVRPDEKLFDLLRKETKGEVEGRPSRSHWFQKLEGKSMRLYGFPDLAAGKIGIGEFSYFFGDPFALRDDLKLHPQFARALG